MGSKQKNRSGKRIFLIVLIILVTTLGGALLFYSNGIGATSMTSKNVTVTIKQGSTSYEVLEQLDEAGLVNSRLAGRIYMKFCAPDNLKANVYAFNKNMTLEEIIRAISIADKKYLLHKKFTVIEGSTIPQAAVKIADITGASKKKVLKQWSDRNYLKTLIDKYWFLNDDILGKNVMYPLEGYFYPGTYFVMSKKPSVKECTEQMLDHMDKKLKSIKPDMEKSRFSIRELIIFASIVESEANFEEDMSAIAGVFMNRLNKNMNLQSDVTINYATQKKHVDVTVVETKIDSKYNTYKYKGLPPGPICFVLTDTIKSCINYEKNDYLYFFATKDGQVIYSRTYAEHQRVVQENKWY